MEAPPQVPLRSRNDVLGFKRTGSRGQILVALDTVHQPRRFRFQGNGTLLLSSHLDREGLRVSDEFLLRSDEGVVVKLAT